jgi:hypothetical protein
MKCKFASSFVWRLTVAVWAGGPGLGAAERNLWTIGIHTGPSPLALSTPANVKNPVLTGADVTDMRDLNIDTVAHPFLVAADSRYYVFFTAKDIKADKGGIGLAESANGREWKFRRTVVRERFVLSHPFVFKWQNEYYMIPEAHSETSVRLYRATAFPDRWKYEGDLIKGGTFISPTLVHHQGTWWMFTSPSGNDTLRLFHARELKGPWIEHPLSPIVKKDPRSARPAGRPFVMGGSLFRLAQDCVPTYGYQVRAFEVTELSPTTYADKLVEAPLVKATTQGWNARAMHHVDAVQVADGQWLAVVDALGR